jgi:ribosome-binding protein aMBF1 (putative translation factor)
MLGHMRRHHTKAPVVSARQIRSEEEKTIPWRETAQESIAKYTESGLMLRGARARAELTQKELADKLEVLPHHISEMEHGKRTIGKEMAKRLSEVLNVNYKVFL